MIGVIWQWWGVSSDQGFLISDRGVIGQLSNHIVTLYRAGLVDDDGQHVHFVRWQGAEVNDCRLPPWQQVAVNAQVSLDLRDAICESFLDVMDQHLRPWQDAVKRNTLGVEV